MTRVNDTVTTRGQAVLSALRDMVLAGRLPAGSRLNEIELAQGLGVSRTPVRAALTALANQDLINYTPNSGYTTRTYSARDLENVFEVRAVLEGLANRQAAEAGLSTEAEDKIRDILAQTATLVSAGTWSTDICDRWVTLNISFHQAINEAAGNQRLLALLEKSPVPVIYAVRYHWFTLDIVSKALDDHVQMFEVIKNRQIGRAEAIGREHIYRTTKPLIDKWRELERSNSHPGEAPNDVLGLLLATAKPLD
ncbi:GntR family transcriptional regulator [Tardiphaga alba]|uniref:GntR family transcriptional regulator n=1 Tax=Tardiphaga alba TaxID=340268 RepID=A0ABX8AEH5_9BRAD|nr:GntR family transcriptional regulator [Tardiphaga alba]QUS41927.1 GntR family transcriptional regulator [Tardiphaga alba]